MKKEIEIFILISHLPYKMVFKDLGSEVMKQVVSMCIDDLQLPIVNTVNYNVKELYKIVKDCPIVTFLTFKVFEALSVVKDWSKQYELIDLVIDENFILIRLKED